MIKFKLQNVATQLNKSVADIARETGLNRNTVTALYHGKIDGIKFSTLELLCKTYRLRLTDLLEITNERESKSTHGLPPKIYKQEASAVPFTCWPWAIAITRPDRSVFSDHYTGLHTYFRHDYGMGYWDYYNMQRVAQGVYRRFNQKRQFDGLYQKFLTHAGAIELQYAEFSPSQVLQLDTAELKAFIDKTFATFYQFWTYSLFIDSFDAGFDQEQIQSIANKHELTLEEVGILTTPEELTFTNERLLVLLTIAKRLARHKSLAQPTLETIKQVISSDAEVAAYIKDFDYYKSNYAHINHITLDEVASELLPYLQDKNLLTGELRRLTEYGRTHAKKQKSVLTKHRLSTNPLEFFARLTYWREYRKQVNLKGIHILDAALLGIQQHTGIPYQYLQYLSFEEIDGVLKGLVTLEALRKRYEEGVLTIVEGGDYRILEGEEANSLRDELEDLLADDREDPVVIPGNIASQGYARGIARTIIDAKEFDRFNEGEILITGMTRPEFVPVMKKAAGIVTNEGGITCHAAIVSRELGKPCIIGTKNATQVIRDGDLVEVRANHGSVRILKRA